MGRPRLEASLDRGVRCHPYRSLRSAMIGLGILLVLILIALFGKYLTPYNYVDPDFTAINQTNAWHWGLG